MIDPVLHHYDTSPFSEKVRLAFGIKGLAWRSVLIPDVMPKPDYTPLTGGYRRTPSLQIGADVYCDSAMILLELERRYPRPSLFPAGDAGLARALGSWSDRAFFMTAVTLIFGSLGDAVSQRFIDDRSALTGSTFDVIRMKAAVPLMREQYRAHLALLDAQLEDGRPFLTGAAPGLADLHPYHVVWFLRTALPTEAGLIEGFPRVLGWESRMAAIGHGVRTEMSASDALETAAASVPDTLPAEDPGEPNGLRPGQRVEVAPDDYGRDLVGGELLMSSAEEIALLRRDPALGEVVVHFPRAGFVVYPRDG